MKSLMTYNFRFCEVTTNVLYQVQRKQLKL